MEYEEEGGYPGSFPEYGAIFMSNAETKKECLHKKLFGLPSAQANFVKCVKAGMVLFLFEFEKRQLYGVYRASSDGAMDIMPHAFKSSGKHFPAQVRFTVIWHCKPLSEHEFRDAISENYYSHNKFNFGLSEDQVRRLLSLFSSRKLENRVPQRQFREKESLIGIKERGSGKARLSSRSRREKLIKEESPARTNSIEYNGDSRSDNKIPEEERFQENSFGYDTMAEHEWDGFGRRKQDSMNLMDDYDVHHSLSNSSCSSRRPSIDNQFRHRGIVYSDHMETANSPTKARNLLAGAQRDTEDSRFQMRDTRGDKHTPSREHFLESKPVQSFEFRQPEFRRPIDEQRLVMDRKMDYDHNVVGDASTDIPAHYVLKRTSVDGDQLYVNDRTEIGHSLDDGIRRVVSNRRDELKRVTDEKTRIPTEHFSSSLVYGSKPNYHDRFSGRTCQETETLVNNSLGPITSLSHYLHPSERVNTSHDDQMLPKKTSSAYTSGKSSGVPLSREYVELRQPKQLPSLNSNKPTLEAHYSYGQNQRKTSVPFPNSMEQTVHGKSNKTSFAMEKYNLAKLMSNDLVRPRTVPYDPDFPHTRVTDDFVTSLKTAPRRVPYDPDFPHDIRISSQSLQDCPPQRSRVTDGFVTSLKTAPLCTEAEKFSQQYNGALGRLSEDPWHERKDLNDHSHQRIGQSLSSGRHRGKMEQPFPSHETYEDPLPLSKRTIYGSRNISISIESDERITSQERVAHDFEENATYPAAGDHRDLLADNGTGREHSRSSFKTFDKHDISSYQDPDYPDGVLTDSEQKRASVFTRLSMSSGKRGQEDEGYLKGDALDPSVDEVMDSLFENLGHKITYTTKHSRSVKLPDTELTLGNMRQYKRSDQIETQKLMNKCTPVTRDEENGEDVLRETRLIGFKRRSETKKRQDVVKTNGVAESSLDQETESSIHKGEGKREREGEDKQLNRRKLIRPSFSKKVELSDSSKERNELKDDTGDGFSVSQLPSYDSSDHNKAAPCGSTAKPPGNPVSPSQSLNSCTPTDLGEITVSITNPKVETNNCSRHEQNSAGSRLGN